MLSVSKTRSFSILQQLAGTTFYQCLGYGRFLFCPSLPGRHAICLSDKGAFFSVCCCCFVVCGDNMLSVPQRTAFFTFVPICWDNMLSVSKTRPFSILSQFGGTVIMLSVSLTRALSILSQFAWTTCYCVSDNTVFYFVLICLDNKLSCFRQDRFLFCPSLLGQHAIVSQTRPFSILS